VTRDFAGAESVNGVKVDYTAYTLNRSPLRIPRSDSQAGTRFRQR
jgi:hypothetical protein